MDAATCFLQSIAGICLGRSSAEDMRGSNPWTLAPVLSQRKREGSGAAPGLLLHEEAYPGDTGPGPGIKDADGGAVAGVGVANDE